MSYGCAPLLHSFCFLPSLDNDYLGSYPGGGGGGFDLAMQGLPGAGVVFPGVLSLLKF